MTLTAEENIGWADAATELINGWTTAGEIGVVEVEAPTVREAIDKFIADWLKVNPAASVKPPQVTPTPTLPFSRGEMKRIVEACDKYGGNRDRIKAFVLAIRYT